MKPLFNEGKHRNGCSCGFCRNRGNIGNWSKAKKEEGKKEEDAGEDKSAEEVAESAAEIVGQLLDSNTPPTAPTEDEGVERYDQHRKDVRNWDRRNRRAIRTNAAGGPFKHVPFPKYPVGEGNPGTPPGIMGTHSFPGMKVPGGSRDRKFTPAKGMVQPTGDEGGLVGQQAKRKSKSV